MYRWVVPYHEAMLGRPTVVLIAHERTDHLRRVLESLANNPDFVEHNFVTAVDGLNIEVETLIRGTRTPDAFVRLEFAPNSSVARRINRVTLAGLIAAFDLLHASHAVVLEDDVIVGPRFLDFVRRIHTRYQRNPAFMAVNGFSNFVGHADPGHVRLNYGVGWGWSISGKTFGKLRSFWNDNPELHWDSLIEGFLRTGFVVNPVYSQTINIGFDETAHHTAGPSIQALGREIKESFELGIRFGLQANTDQRQSVAFEWREDCVPIDKVSSGHRVALMAFQHLRFRLEKIWRTSSGRKKSYSWWCFSKVNMLCASMQRRLVRCGTRASVFAARPVPSR